MYSIEECIYVSMPCVHMIIACMCAVLPMNFIGYVSARFPVSLYVSVHAIMSIIVFFNYIRPLITRDLCHRIPLTHYDMHCHVIMYDGIQ